MRFATDYGTIEFLADTEDDVLILNKLIDSLSEKAENFYDNGDYDIFTGQKAGNTYSGVRHGQKMTVSFNR